MMKIYKLKGGFMKEIILKELPQIKCCDREEILNLEVDKFVNSDFKNYLKKDISRGATLSPNKFYLLIDGCLIRVQFNDEVKRIVIQLSQDIGGLTELSNFISVLEKQDLSKIEFVCNSNFIKAITFVKQRNYEIELKRKDKFFNSDFENQVVLSKFKGE